MERMKTQVELLKESCDIKDAACVRYQKRIAELEEENKKLKEKLSEITMVADDEKQSIEHILELEEDNRDLVEKIEKLLWEKIKLEEENKKLKSDLAFERTMLDNVRAEYKSLQNVNKKLKETIKDHQLYEEKLEHRIIEFEELLHGE